jgi:hypothetical protein
MRSYKVLHRSMLRVTISFRGPEPELGTRVRPTNSRPNRSGLWCVPPTEWDRAHWGAPHVRDKTL